MAGFPLATAFILSRSDVASYDALVTSFERIHVAPLLVNHTRQRQPIMQNVE
jgi:hypothetical protein